MEKTGELNQEAKAKGYIVIGMTNSAIEVKKPRRNMVLLCDFYTCDAIALKTIERGNSSIVVLEKGTNKKVHYNDIEDLKYK
jgi:hypothetical protein